VIYLLCNQNILGKAEIEVKIRYLMMSFVARFLLSSPLQTGVFQEPQCRRKRGGIDVKIVKEGNGIRSESEFN
jgi:hypothetical protein